MGTPTVSDKIEDAKQHGLLHLSQHNLARCPLGIFAAAELQTTLLRLDLSFNLLTTLPEAISSLSALQVLWINDNPRLVELPATLVMCSQLTVVDASNTALRALPSNYWRLERLKVLEISGTPLEKRWLEKKHISTPKEPHTSVAQGALCDQIRRKLRRKDERTLLKCELYEKLHDDVYRMKQSDTVTAEVLRATIQRLMKLFPHADEIRSIVRNAERFFPSLCSTTSLRSIKTDAFRRAFDQLRTENDMKKRTADLELKIRALYFDRIDPTKVEGMVNDICKEIHQLDDIHFLIKHASALFPKEAKDVDGKHLQQALVALQNEIARARAEAVDKVLIATRGIYTEVDPVQVQSLVTRVVSLFMSTEDLCSLAADATTLFPNEFLNANPPDIRAAFVRQKAEAMGTTSSTSTISGSTASKPSALASAKRNQKQK